MIGARIAKGKAGQMMPKDEADEAYPEPNRHARVNWHLEHPLSPSLFAGDQAQKLAEQMFAAGDALLSREMKGYSNWITNEKRLAIQDKLAHYIEMYLVLKKHAANIDAGREDDLKKTETNIRDISRIIEINVTNVLRHLSTNSNSGAILKSKKYIFNRVVCENIFHEMRMIPSEVKDDTTSPIELQRQIIGHLELLAEASRRVASRKLPPARAKDEMTPQLVHYLVDLFPEWAGQRFKKTLEIDYETSRRSEFRSVCPRFLHEVMLIVEPDIASSTIQAILQKPKRTKK